jgi:hypothetical protein
MRALSFTKTQRVQILVVALVPPITSASNSPAFSFSFYMTPQQNNSRESERGKKKNVISVQSREVREKSEMINNIKKMETTLATVDDEEGSGVQETRERNCEHNIKHLPSFTHTHNACTHIHFLMI